jgi:hypothetical protein
MISGDISAYHLYSLNCLSKEIPLGVFAISKPSEITDTTTIIEDDNVSPSPEKDPEKDIIDLEKKDPAPEQETQEEVEEKKEEVLVLDGPLSQIYTKALQEVYSKESDPTAMQIEKIDGDDREGSTEEEPKMEVKGGDVNIQEFIYACDGSEVSGEDINNFSKAINRLSHIDCKVTLVMEGNKQLSTCASYMDELATKCGARVIFSRENAIRHLTNVLNKL